MSRIRVLCKRKSLKKRLDAVCAAKGFRFVPTHENPMSGWTDGETADFLIVTSDTVFSVKLIGSYSKSIYFNYVDPGHYEIRDMRFQFSAAAAQVPYEVKTKPRYDFTSCIPAKWAEMKVVPVILMNPLSANVSSTSEGQRKPLFDGDPVSEGLFYSGSGFIRMLSEMETK